MQKHEKGYLIALSGVVLTLLWIGIFKFTPAEAALIRPLVASHPLMNWLYSVLSEQGVSNLIGITEIIIATGLIVGLKYPRIGFLSGLAASGIFIATLSFLFTKPNAWRVVDGVLITDFFLFKDLVFLGISLMTVERTYSKINGK